MELGQVARERMHLPHTLLQYRSSHTIPYLTLPPTCPPAIPPRQTTTDRETPTKIETDKVNTPRPFKVNTPGS
eukprot:2623516-Rhodomonas_salina.1